MMQSGEYYVGDLCYVLHEVWDEVCELTFTSNANGFPTPNDGEFTLKDGRKFALYSTTYGDGLYFDQYRNEYGVDAGSIGCILKSDIDFNAKSDWGGENDTEGGQIIMFDRDFPTGKTEFGEIEIGHIVIPTDSDYDDDGQPDEMQEWQDFDPDC
jgi:hypothetical protein